MNRRKIEGETSISSRIAEGEIPIISTFLLAIITGIGLGIGLYIVRKKLK